MTDFYSEMADMVVEMTKPTSEGGLGTGIIVMHRPNSPMQAPNVAFDSNFVAGHDVYEFTAGTLGVSTKYVDGEQVAADDIQIWAPPFAKKNGVYGPFEPMMTDEIFISGKSHRINKVERYPADGIPSAFCIFVKS